MLKKRLKEQLKIEHQALQLEGQLLTLETDMKPSSICKLTNSIIACTCDTTSEVYTITVSWNGHVLSGSVTPLLLYPERRKRVQSMCLGSQSLPSRHQQFLAVQHGTENLGESCYSSERPPPNRVHTLHLCTPRQKHSLYRPRQQAA